MITLIPDGGQFCPGHILTYECTACSGQATVWTGNALRCDHGVNRVSLLHSVDFVDSRKCNRGAIVCYVVGIVNDCYVSQMNVTLNSDVQEMEIQCGVDDGHSRTLLLLGSSVIPRIGTSPLMSMSMLQHAVATLLYIIIIII